MSQTISTNEKLGNDHFDLIVVGGGAAGFFCAINAAKASSGLKVAIFEGGPRFLTKVEISGGGRCNVTHSCFDPKKLTENYPRGGKELLGPFFRFQPKDTVQWFNERGIEFKTEADGRIFPVSNSSKTIIDCFLTECRNFGIELFSRLGVTEISYQKESEQKFLVVTKTKTFSSKFLLLATGSAH